MTDNRAPVDRDAVAQTLCRLVARVQAGETVTVDMAAAEFGIPPIELAAIWAAHVVPALAEAKRRAH